MRKVRFLTPHRGVETHEHLYQPGDVAELADHMAELLVKNGVAVLVVVEKPIKAKAEVVSSDPIPEADNASGKRPVAKKPRKV